MLNPPKRGGCEICNTEFDKETYIDDENPHLCGYRSNCCPECGYKPGLVESLVELIIDHPLDGLKITQSFSLDNLLISKQDNCEKIAEKIITSLRNWKDNPYSNKTIDFFNGNVPQNLDAHIVIILRVNIRIVISRNGMEIEIKQAMKEVCRMLITEIKACTKKQKIKRKKEPKNALHMRWNPPPGCGCPDW